MLIEEALKDRLITHAGLAALIGGRALAFAVSEISAFPAVTFQRISTTPLHHRSGYGLESLRFQLDGWARSYTEALALRQQMRGAMDGWQRGSAPRVDYSRLEDDRDIREASPGRYRASMDYMIWATES